MDRHVLITEETAFKILAMLSKQPNCASLREEIKSGLFYADLADHANDQPYIHTSSEFFVVWNPLNMRPITAQFGSEADATQTGISMATDFKENFFVMKAVAKLVPGPARTCQLIGLENAGE